MAVRSVCRSFPIMLVLAGCGATPALVRDQGSGPAFSPIAFFDGDTAGGGRLKIAALPVRRVEVVGHGTVEPDGSLLLVQHVFEGAKPERVRTWHIRATGIDRYTGTLSDARGAVDIDVHGNVLHIAYVAKGGFPVVQWLILQPGGQVALNHLVVRKLGLRIASLRETITRR